MSELKKVIYKAHRKNQRERILNAAGKLFLEKGVDSVSIEAIAKEAMITRRTIYQYFDNKFEIALYCAH
ncbi:regulatory protein TetR [Spirochaeta thermophila DSM 6578]|uniref:Regulatory protein TetR n=1 Tax=Winmispira thermophila (strain ATCC 700085 / DSM 6578 / Z-1203) TaxID=869211 RepID=G0GEQ0_WINT7|nr:helix-turn-helix domain-containing protein [Spirochaeta thermophila]AEJ60738.1 regulatory protein TetR [Spirochaeta thermophila DSM 6578]